MPELPEAETVRSGLAARFCGRRISRVQVLHPGGIKRHRRGDFAAQLLDKKVAGVSRQGKYLWFSFVDSELIMVAHLGMSGQLLACLSESKHVRVRIDFEDRCLLFVDPRRFGSLALDVLSEGRPSMIAHIAKDPLDSSFCASAFIRYRSRRAAKEVLLDQKVIAGLGNIYVSEVLWRCGIRPDQPWDSLNALQKTAVLCQSKQVLLAAMAYGGTSFDQQYVNVNGAAGSFGKFLRVYGRKDRPCYQCGTVVVSFRQGGRSSFFCPRCQR